MSSLVIEFNIVRYSCKSYLMKRVEEFGSFDVPVLANLSAVSLPMISQ